MASPAGCRGTRRYHRRRLATHAAALVCDPPVRGWGRRPRGTGVAGTRIGDHDADLYHGPRARAARSLGRGPSTCALAGHPARERLSSRLLKPTPKVLTILTEVEAAVRSGDGEARSARGCS